MKKNVALNGPQGQKTVEVGIKPATEPPQSSAGKDHHRRAAFAAMNALEGYFLDERLPSGYAWAIIKNEYEVESHSELTEMQWSIISARLNACRRDAGLRYHFIEKVRAFDKKMDHRIRVEDLMLRIAGMAIILNQPAALPPAAVENGMYCDRCKSKTPHKLVGLQHACLPCRDKPANKFPVQKPVATPAPTTQTASLRRQQTASLPF